MSLVLESAIKGSLILGVALSLLPLLKSAPAALRHWVIAAGLLCAAITPIVVLAVPAWHVPAGLARGAAVVSPPGRDAQVEVSVEAGTGSDSTGAAGGPSVPAAPVPGGKTLLALLRWVWIATAAGGVAMLLVGLARLGAVAARARRITTGTWFDRCEQVRREYGIRRTLTLMQSPGPALLVTWGIVRPKLMVPAAALGWSDNRVRSVLYHELAHVRRGDWIVQLVADLLRSIFWFNPLVWLACARLRSEGEQACDDAVLNRGIDGAAYALDLVDIARDLRRSPRWAPGAAIAHTSNLERRIRAMLDTRLNRRPVSRSVRLATLLGLLTIAVPLGALAAFQTSFSTLSGSIVDPLNGALPAATVVVTNENSQAKYEVQSDRTGHYEVGGLPPGDYLLEVRLPGFATLKQKLTVTGQSIERNMVLQVGSVQETIVVAGSGDPATRISQAPKRERVERPCGAPPAAEGVPIGGNLRPPAKLRDVRPDYPAALRDAGVEGTIVLRGRLGSDGFLHDLTPQPAADARLARAAIDAAAQWEFAPTLLNCVAIDIPITITVTFRR